jgi:triacylglycerol lipase
MGKSSFEQQALEAEQQIRNILNQTRSTRIHFIGHSAGGLVARALAYRFKDDQYQVASVVTIASPHRGARLAEMALQAPEKKPLLYKSMRAFGYDLEKRRHLLEPLTSQSLTQFNLQYKDIENVRYGSVAAGLDFFNLPLAMMLTYKHANQYHEKSDGLVELSSQYWGQTLAQPSLDHGAVLGFSLAASPQRRKRERQEFCDMMDAVLNFIKENPNR